MVVDVTNPAEIRAAGIRALNSALGNDGARIFIKQFFGGRGDYTKEKYERPDLTPEEFAAVMEEVTSEADD
jgi:hypothetical protein